MVVILTSPTCGWLVCHEQLTFHCKLGTPVRYFVAGCLESLNYKDGGKELEQAKVREKLNGCIKGYR